jgi:hypothetical protein
MEIVQGAEGSVDGDWKSLGRAPWVHADAICVGHAGRAHGRSRGVGIQREG